MMHAVTGRMSLPIHLFARGVRPTTAEDFAARVLRSRLEGLGTNFRRLGIQLTEVIDRDGDLEMVCKVKVTLAKAFDAQPFVVEGHATHVRDAVGLVASSIEAEVRRAIEEAGTPPARRASRNAGRAAAKPTTITVRRARDGKVHEAVSPPDQSRRWPGKEGTTAHPARGRHVHTTRHQAQATTARETSATARPSRKSTRKSANRSKRDSNLERQTQRNLHSPESRPRA